jgi:hypothetical protein
VLGDSRYIERGLVTYISLSLSLSLSRWKKKKKKKKVGEGVYQIDSL